VTAVCAAGWLCVRHYCDTCGEQTRLMCVFCPASYCKQHADANINTRSFTLNSCRIRHRICNAHGDVVRSTAACSSKSNSTETQHEIVTDVVIGGSSDAAEETIGAGELTEPVTEASTYLQTAGSVDETEMITAPRDLCVEPDGAVDCAITFSKHPPTDRRPLVKPAAGDSERRFVAAELRKRNGVVLEAGILSGSLSAFEEDSQIQNEKPGDAEKSTEFARSTERRKSGPAAVNGFCVTMTTRRRSTLRENSQTLNITASRLDTSVINGSTVDPVTALLEGLSDSKELGLMNGKDLMVDGN